VELVGWVGAEPEQRFKSVVRADEVLFLDARQEQAEAAEVVEETVEDLPF
jgi:hypothetical protein